MTSECIEFGYYPEPLEVQAGPVTITPLPNLAETVAGLARSAGIHNGWVYAPAQEAQDMSGALRTLPYPSRVFALPKTHTFQHLALESNEHLSFHLWTLSFFTGMVLTETEAGFVDATPLKPGSLVDFHVTRGNLARAIELSEAFWMANPDHAPVVRNRVTAVAQVARFT